MEYGELVDSAARTLLSAVATDAWSAARDGLLQLFGRFGNIVYGRNARVEDWLNADVSMFNHPEVSQSGRDDLRRQLLPLWATRFSEILVGFADGAEGLHGLATQIQPQLPPGSQVWMAG